MKKTALLLILLVLACRGSGEAQERPFGIGLALGEPSYLTVKTGPFAFGAGGSGFGTLHLHGDYWFVNDPLDSSSLSWFLGLGVKAGFLDQGEKPWNAPFAPGIRFYPFP